MASKIDDEWEDVPAVSTQASADSEWEDVPSSKSSDRGITDKIVDESTLGNIIGGFTKGPSIGEYMPVVGPLVANASRAVVAGVQSPFSKESFSQLYKKQVDAAEKERAAYEKEYPAAANTKAFLGAAAMPFGKIAESAIPASGWLAGLGRGVINTAEGSAVAGADQAARGNVDEVIPAAKEAGKWGGIINGGLSGIHGAGLLYSRVMAGLRPETLERYVERRVPINSTNEPEVVDEAANAINSIKDNVLSKKENLKGKVDRADIKNRDLYNESLSDAKNNSALTKSQAIKDYENSILKENALAQELRDKSLTESMNRGKENLSRADKLEREAAMSIQDMMLNSRKKIGEASGKAMNALDSHGNEIPLAWFKGKLSKGINDNRFGEALLPNEGVDQLVKYRSLLDEAGVKAVPAKDMKKLIQSLDADLSQAYANAQNGNYNTPAIRSLMAMRRLASARLKKEVPGYSQAMQPVAEMTGKIKGLQRDFPNVDADKIYSKTKNINSPGKESLKNRLAQAEQTFGGNALSKFDEANQLKNLDETGGQSFEVPNQQVLDYIKAQKENSLNQSNQAFMTQQQRAEAERLARDKIIDEYKKKHSMPIQFLESKIKGMGEDSVQSRLRRMGGNPDANIIMRRKMDEIGDISGKGPNYFTEKADDLAVKRAMEGSFTRGSRNVNLATYSLKGLANTLGLGVEGTNTLGSVGAILGGITDIMGPKMVKAVIDVGATKPGMVARESLKRAALAGPQAFAAEHARILRENPEYRQEYEKAMSQ
jgi:hypothetical protein